MAQAQIPKEYTWKSSSSSESEGTKDTAETESTVSRPPEYYPTPSKINKVAKIGITRSSVKSHKRNCRRKFKKLRAQVEKLQGEITQLKIKQQDGYTITDL